MKEKEKGKGKWVTPNNMWAWILLGILLVMFGICMGIWKDGKNKTVEKMVNNDVMNRMIDILLESYTTDQKLQNINQINELQEEDYANYRIVLQDNKITNEVKLDHLKRKVVYLHYIPNASMDAPGKIQKIKALSFSKETSLDIVEVLTKEGDPATKIDQINNILKEDL